MTGWIGNWKTVLNQIISTDEEEDAPVDNFSIFNHVNSTSTETDQSAPQDDDDYDEPNTDDGYPNIRELTVVQSHIVNHLRLKTFNKPDAQKIFWNAIIEPCIANFTLQPTVDMLPTIMLAGKDNDTIIHKNIIRHDVVVSLKDIDPHAPIQISLIDIKKKITDMRHIFYDTSVCDSLQLSLESIWCAHPGCLEISCTENSTHTPTNAAKPKKLMAVDFDPASKMFQFTNVCRPHNEHQRPIRLYSPLPDDDFDITRYWLRFVPKNIQEIDQYATRISGDRVRVKKNHITMIALAHLERSIDRKLGGNRLTENGDNLYYVFKETEWQMVLNTIETVIRERNTNSMVINIRPYYHDSWSDMLNDEMLVYKLGLNVPEFSENKTISPFTPDTPRMSTSSKTSKYIAIDTNSENGMDMYYNSNNNNNNNNIPHPTTTAIDMGQPLDKRLEYIIIKCEFALTYRCNETTTTTAATL